MSLPVRRALATAQRRVVGLAGVALVLVGVLAAFAGFTLALGAAEARVAANKPSWSGTWDCPIPINRMVLWQSGSSLSGTYTGVAPPANWGGRTAYDGRISGTITYTKFELGRFEGTWTDVGDAEGRTGKLLMQMFVYEGRNVIGMAHSRWGNNMCKGTSASPGTTTPPTTTTKPPATTTQGDTSAPVVRVYAPEGIQKPGTYVTLGASVKDDSGRATLTATLFDGGEPVRSARGTGAATGQRLSWRAPLRADLKGPLYFCAWAEDAAGNKSARAPRSSCAWVTLLVDIDLVSNTCGGAGWESVVAVENTFGNTSVYVDDASDHPYTVSFVDACNLHDAGYGGQTVYDRINKEIVDYHRWSRKQVDHKFRSDMVKLCRRQIPPSATSALSKCIRDDRRYLLVRLIGHKFFDANLMEQGTQKEGHRDNG